MSNTKLIVAIDTPDMYEAVRLARLLAPHVDCFKLGLEFYLEHGKQGYIMMAAYGRAIMLDLKLYGTPTTVNAAMGVLAQLQPWAVTVAAMAGRNAIAAANVVNTLNPPLIFAVTVPTSMDEAELSLVGLDLGVQQHVNNLAYLAVLAGADGIICSPLEVGNLRISHPEWFIARPLLIATPGIPPYGKEVQHARYGTPANAAANGSDYLIVGRAITQADDPVGAAKAIRDQIRSVQS